MTSTISVRLDRELLKAIAEVERNWQTDRSEVVRRLLVSSLHEEKLKNTFERIVNNKISVGKAAEECGITLWELLELLKEKKIDWTGYSEDDVERELKLLK